jgi:hypothetical protein
MLPNLIVIGAAKCGTTSLYHYLKPHPEIWMSEEKELDFFTGNWHRGVPWYERFFPRPDPVRGEASPSYTQFPVYRGVPERMAGLVGDAKLLYVVRDPIERFVSHYTFDSAFGFWKRPFDETVAELESGRLGVAGRYWLQLEQYLDHFRASQILVVDNDDLLSRRAEALEQIFRFLGVDASFASPEFDVVHNPSPKLQRRLPVVLAVRGIRRTLGRRRTVALLERVPQALAVRANKQIEPPVLDDRQRERLVDYYAEDVARLRAFTGLPFESWSL